MGKPMDAVGGHAQVRAVIEVLPYRAASDKRFTNAAGSPEIPRAVGRPPLSELAVDQHRSRLNGVGCPVERKGVHVALIVSIR